MADAEIPDLKTLAIETLEASVVGLRAAAEQARETREALRSQVELANLEFLIHTAQADAIQATVALLKKQEKI